MKHSMLHMGIGGNILTLQKLALIAAHDTELSSQVGVMTPDLKMHYFYQA